MLLKIVVMVLTGSAIALLAAIAARQGSMSSLQLILIPLLSSFLLACFHHRRLPRGTLVIYWGIQAMLSLFLLCALLGSLGGGAVDKGAMIIFGWLLAANISGMYLAYCSQKKYRLADKAGRQDADRAMASFSRSPEGLIYMRRAQRLMRMQGLMAVIFCSLGYNVVRQLEHLKQYPEAKYVLMGETAIIAILTVVHFLAKKLLYRWKTMTMLLEAGLSRDEALEKMQLRGDALAAAVASGKQALYNHNPAQANIWRDKVIALLQDKYKITPVTAAREMSDNGAAAFDTFFGVKPEKRANDICKSLAKTHRNDPAVFVSIAADAAKPTSL